MTAEGRLSPQQHRHGLSVTGETQKALEKYNEALPIFQAVGDRSGEANTLRNIGSVYDSLGEIQKALESYNDALPIYRAEVTATEKLLPCWGLREWSKNAAILLRLAKPLNRLSA